LQCRLVRGGLASLSDLLLCCVQLPRTDNKVQMMQIFE
jgi:hypothetical protein